MSSPDPLVVFRRVPSTLQRQNIEDFAAGLSRRLRTEFTCMVTTDAELKRLNTQFRRANYPTDVLSFPGSNELAISYQRAKAQAREFGHAVEQEIELLMLHGVLHLLGLDHETDRGEMGRRESLWRRKLGLPNGLITRVRA
jgi:probable rRNA maturation factor